MSSISSLIGAEGLRQIGNSASIIHLCHRLGLRLSHPRITAIIYTDAALAINPVHKGLSMKGKEIVRVMNRIGILLDLSYTSDVTMSVTLSTPPALVKFSYKDRT